MKKARLCTTTGTFLLISISLYLVIADGDMCASMVTAVSGDDRDALLGKTLSAFRRTCCITTKSNTKKEFEDLERSNCSFSTETRNRRFILRPMAGSFLLKFDIKGISNALISLATDRINSSIFAEIGFGTGNQAIAAFIRPCFFDADPDCEVSVAKFKDAQPTLSETEERPFWIEYAEEGVVTAGKGGEQGEGLMVWDDVVDYHGHLPSVVHVSIASLMPADWLFHDFCEYM